MIKLFVINSMVSISLTVAMRFSMLGCHAKASGWWFAALAIFVMTLMYGGGGDEQH